jgi:hypothetical protein
MLFKASFTFVKAPYGLTVGNFAIYSSMLSPDGMFKLSPIISDVPFNFNALS